MIPVDPATPIAITLQVQHWNTVLAILSDQPYRIAEPLIKEITTQANAVLAPPAPAPAALANGADQHVQD